MAKRKADLLCYIHQVSPQKRNKSFNLKVQLEESRDKVTRAICFDSAKYSLFKTKQISGEPLKINNAVLQQPTNQNFASVIINKSSVLTEIEPVQVNFPKCDPVVKHYTIDSIKDVGEVISLKAKVNLSNTKESFVLCGKHNLRVLNGAILSDSTGQICLSLWEEWIDYLKGEVSEGKVCFDLKNLIVKEFDGEMQLSTCSDTSITLLIEEFDTVSVKEEPNKERYFVKEIICIREILYEYECISCCNGVTALLEDLIACASCSSTMKKSAMKKRVMLKVQFSNIDGQYKIDAHCLKQFNLSADPTDFFTDRNFLTKEVMHIKNFYVTIDGCTATLTEMVEASNSSLDNVYT